MATNDKRRVIEAFLHAVYAKSQEALADTVRKAQVPKSVVQDYLREYGVQFSTGSDHVTVSPAHIEKLQHAVKYSRVWRNQDPKFNDWWQRAGQHLDQLDNLPARTFIEAAISDPGQEAKLSEDSVADIYQWAIKHALTGWVQGAQEKPVLDEPLLEWKR